MYSTRRNLLVLVLAALAYFVAYPDDAQAITTPLATFASLTTAISPGLYAVMAAGIIAVAIVKTWGGRAGA